MPIVGVVLVVGALDAVSPLPVELDETQVPVHVTVRFGPSRLFVLCRIGDEKEAGDQRTEEHPTK